MTQLWELKMCRLALQLLGMLGNILGLLGLLGMLCNVLGMLGNVLGLLGMPFRKVLGVLHRRKTPPTCCLISCEVKGVVYHQASIYETWWYSSMWGGFSSMWDSQDLAEACRGQPRTLQSMLRTLPSMPRSCKASLHILGSHNIYIYIYIDTHTHNPICYINSFATLFLN